jgi:predicted transcriptional regulator of viral defense system
MTQTEKILQLARRHHGTVTTAQVSEEGIHRGNLASLLAQGRLERAGRGVYVLPDMPEDEWLTLQSRFKRGVFSLETALFLHGLTDRTPDRFSMTFPAGYNIGSPRKEHVRVNRVKTELHGRGVEEMKSPGGHSIRAYDAERTLCDILKGRSGTDANIVSDAFRRYVRRRKKDIPRLSAYAKLLRVEGKVRAYLEALL